ncbi:unnamed protein product [Rodentolepis nana]|uniref:Uncharacterized protein n=1 Tax=Rodentolepis nana TaxID=102285 RepID=A0A3P7V437_RODNA|nr:unnamed protein product [Rodentolepis nana]
MNVYEEDYLFTTQAHILPIARIRKLANTLRDSPFKTVQFPSETPLCESNKWEGLW